MTVAFRGISSRISGTGATLSLTQDIPSLADGDYMVMLIYGNLNPATPPQPPLPDWTFIDGETTGNNYIQAWGKVANSEPGSYTISINTGSKTYAAGIVAFYSDAAKALVVDVHDKQSNAASTNRTCPDVTTTKASAGLLCAFHLDGNQGSTPPGDMNERWDELATTLRIYAMTAILAGAGNTGDKVATGATMLASRAVTVAIVESDPATGDPTDLVATALSSTEIGLAWADNSSNETGYSIERSPNGSSSWVEIDTVAANEESYTDTGLTPFTHYFYRVRAFNVDGETGYSNTDDAITFAALVAPTGLTATPTLSTKIVLSWSDANANEDNFVVERSANGTTGWASIATPTLASHDNTSLTANTTYYYRVKAVRGAEESSYSSVANATTFPALSASAGLSLLATSPTAIQLSWSDANAIRTGFSVERSTTGIGGWAEIATPTASPYTATGLTPGTTYYFRVRPYRTGSTEYGGYTDIESAATLSSSPVRHLRLYLLQPTVIFTARVNMASASYPLNELNWDGLIEGDHEDIRHGMTLTIGSTQYADDLGRQRIRGDSTSSLLRVGRSSKGTRDGELTATDNAYISVYDDHRVWAKIPYIAGDGEIFKDAEIDYSDQTLEPPPVAIAGPGVAATIDGSDTITVAFDGSDSYATADGATIVNYGWDLKDGSVIDGAVDEAQVTATFPPGFRWINLTVEDSNGKQMTTHRPVYARDPAEDGQPGGCITYFQIESHRIALAGQQLVVRIRQEIDADNYPDGTLAMLWEGEPATAEDRSHMLFIGWHQTDPATIQAERTGALRDVVLQCVDVAGRLDTLPGFPQTVERDDTPDSWSQMADLNIDRFMHYLLMWDSTALELADFYWSGTGDDYEFVRLEAAGDSLYDQIERQAARICPDHHFTCNTVGQLFVNPDPMLQDTGDRTATVQATLTAADWSDIRYAHQRPPRVRQLWGEALQADDSEIIPLFCVAPGNAPGQGEIEQRHGEQLATSQSSLNATTGHRYARLNAPQGTFNISLAQGNDLAIEPADLTWVELTIPAAVAAQRGLAFTEARGLVKEVSIRYSHDRGGLVKTVDLQWERETSGSAAATFVPAAADPVDDGNDWTPPPVGNDLIPPPAPASTIQVVGMLDSLGNIFTTSNFQSSPPTWALDNTLTGDFPASNEILSFVVDPFSPGYRDLGTEINAFVATEDGIWKIGDMFGTPTATEIFTFDQTATAAFGQWRTIHASFGRFQETETDNPWIMVISHYGGGFAITGTWAVYSTDAGQTWSSEIEITADFDAEYAEAAVIHYPMLWLSPRTPGYAITAAYDGSDNPVPYYTDDWGATWGVLSDPAIDTGDLLGGCLHVPWPDNDNESVLYYGRATFNGTILDYRTMRNTTDITAVDTAINYGPQHGLFGIRTYDSDRRYVVMVGRGNGATDDMAEDQAGVFVSNDYGDTWDLIYGPLTTDINDRFPMEAAFSGDNPDVIFIWESERAVSFSDDFGASVEDKSGNLHALGGSILPFRGFFGGPT